MPPLRALTAASLALVTLALALPARAQPTQVPRVVVLRFTGWHADQARQILAEEIAPFVELVDEQRAVFAAQELGVDVSTPEGMQEVVEHLGVSLVIAGAVEGRRASATMQIIVVDSAGEELATETAPAPVDSNRPAIGAAANRAIEAAQEVLRARESPPEPEPEPEPEPAPIVEPEPEPQPEPEPIAWRQPYVTALAGLRIRSASTRVENEAAGPPFGFSADAYPEIDVLTVFRPLAEAPDASRGLWLGLEGSFSVGIAYVGADGNERGMTSFHLRVDAGYGYVLAEVFELVGMIGFGVDGMLLDDPDGFPSALYSYLRPAILGRIRAYEDLFLIELGVGGRIGLDGGDLGPAYGPGLFFGGLDLVAGVGGIIAPGFAWTARFGYAYQALSFDGAGGSLGDGLTGSDEVFEGRFLVGAAL